MDANSPDTTADLKDCPPGMLIACRLCIHTKPGDPSSLGVFMAYFADVSVEGRALWRQLPSVIGVIESREKQALIRTASERGRTDDGGAVWVLKIRGIEIPGHFVIVDGAFIEIEPTGH
jgi:hypothetical protein